ncbi:MAG: sigma-70 family RNA polymerase sigma factor [Pseudomonadota bacterium]
MPEPEDSDAALLARYGAGDVGAAQILSKRLVPAVMAFAARTLGDRAEAEDVAQETMLRLWRMAPNWQSGEATVKTWVYRVASNLCTDRLRKRGRVTVSDPTDFDQMRDETEGGQERLERIERATALQNALESLPPRQSQAVILRHIEGLSNPEIAQIMEIGVEAVESLTARGKRALAERLLPQAAKLGLDNG